MNKIALLISRPGMSSRMVQQGYVDALRYLGWKVCVGNPKTKLGCRKMIEDYGVKLIMTHSRFGMRQLPIEAINANGVTVFVDALPLNDGDEVIDGPYDFAHRDEPDIVAMIGSVIVYTRLEPHLWPRFMHLWQNNNILHIPVAGNLIKALPPTCTTLTDVAMVANFSNRQGIMQKLIEPLFKRLDLLGHRYQAFGDNIWQLAGLSYNGPLVDHDKLAHIYATARVCPNVHTEQQVKLQALVNERSFMIPLCGGIQVSDNPLVSKYLGLHCEIATSTTDYIKKVIDNIENQNGRFDKIKAGSEYVANNHTYFNRLIDLFHAAGLSEFAGDIETEGKRVAIKHCWEMDARLSAAERNVPYVQDLLQ